MKFRRVLPVVAAAAACFGSPCHAIDLEAGDYTALPAGTNVGLLYLQHAARDKLYSRGQRLPSSGSLVSDIGILRGVHFTELGGYIANPQFLLPFGRLYGKGGLGGLGSNTGVGDLILAAAVFGSRPGDTVHYAVMPYLWLPTGQYDRTDPLSLGENRWKAALQVGGSMPLASALTVDLMADVTVFGRNRDANDGNGGATTLSQKPFFDVQAHLRYQANASTDLRLQLAQSFGGETKLAGTWQDNRLSSTRVKLGVGHFFRPGTQVIGSYLQDLKVREGFKISRGVQVRLLQLF